MRAEPSLQNALTRVAGGRSGGAGGEGGRRAAGLQPQGAPRRLVVDVREFMSSLPCVLHQQVRMGGLQRASPAGPRRQGVCGA